MQQTTEATGWVQVQSFWRTFNFLSNPSKIQKKKGDKICGLIRILFPTSSKSQRPTHPSHSEPPHGKLYRQCSQVHWHVPIKINNSESTHNIMLMGKSHVEFQLKTLALSFCPYHQMGTPWWFTVVWEISLNWKKQHQLCWSMSQRCS